MVVALLVVGRRGESSNCVSEGSRGKGWWKAAKALSEGAGSGVGRAGGKKVVVVGGSGSGTELLRNDS